MLPINSKKLRINLLRLTVLALSMFMGLPNAAAQEAAPPPEAKSEVPTAPVVLDGRTLFNVRGVSAFPAERRARQIEDRINAVARDRGFAAQNLRLVETPYGTSIQAGDLAIMSVLDADAFIEGVRRQVLAQAFLTRIKESIEAFRYDRQPGLLTRHVICSLAAALALFLGLLVGVRTVRRLHLLLTQRYKDKIRGLEFQDFQLLHERQIWNMLSGALTFIEICFVFVACYATLYYILSVFPWTRGLGQNLFGFFLNPLSTMANSFVGAIPDLIFLAVLAVITHYILKLIRLVFAALESGAITLSGFEPEWAKPTYRLVRSLLIAFALVVAFPYIPGSNTQAFKGLSLFIGLIVSLGSTSLIGNLISGYSLTYRRAFRVGDRVKIGDHVGYVEKSTMMVTYLHTTKNEVIAVPNSQIINTEVVNYTSLARTSGLILHTTVGIGYETSWRQVEAMLLEAAARTPGLLREPPPFVHQKELGDFAVTYEINAHCDDAKRVERLYTLLHQNILDVFNEYGVQIMTPAYEGDPEQAKVVPKAEWYAAPAHAESTATGASGGKEQEIATGP